MPQSFFFVLSTNMQVLCLFFFFCWVLSGPSPGRVGMCVHVGHFITFCPFLWFCNQQTELSKSKLLVVWTLCSLCMCRMWSFPTPTPSLSLCMWAAKYMGTILNAESCFANSHPRCPFLVVWRNDYLSAETHLWGGSNLSIVWSFSLGKCAVSQTLGNPRCLSKPFTSHRHGRVNSPQLQKIRFL